MADCPRSTILEFAQISAAVLDNPDRPQSVRERARQTCDECSEALLYHNDPSKRFQLVPLAFHCSGYYRDFVAEVLSELPQEVVASEPVRVCLVRKAAALIDDESFCSTFRLEAAESLAADPAVPGCFDGGGKLTGLGGLMKHVCSDSWVRVYRMMLALIMWDDESYRYAAAELGDCPFCLKNALGTVLHLHSNNYALQAGGLDRAAEYLTDELQRRLMPSEDDTARMAQLDRMNRMRKKPTE
jgi:hypothetical protein